MIVMRPYQPSPHVKGVTRYVIERKGQLYLVEDDIRFPLERRARKIKMTADEIERRWPGLLERAVADGLVPEALFERAMSD
jgi:hypothetical protein